MYIQYKLEVEGIFKDRSLSITSYNNVIREVELLFEETESKFDILFVKFRFNKIVKNLKEAEDLTRPLLTDFINLLIYKFRAILREPTIHSYNVLETSVLATGSITLYNQPNYKLTEDDSNWLSKEIKNHSLLSKLKFNTYFLQYKSIIAIEDNVSRFLLLYGLLYQIKSNQKSVDKYIESEENNVIKLQTTRTDPETNVRLTYTETIYTWWRNQAQHMDKSTDVDEVANQFNILESSLNDLVFKAINNQIK